MNLLTSLVRLLQCPYIQDPQNEEIRQSFEKCCKKMISVGKNHISLITYLLLCVARDEGLLLPPNIEDEVQVGLIIISF